jgi:hypothetical protein
MKKCDANVESENASKIFPIWSEKVLDKLTLRYSLRSIPIGNLTSGLSV